MEKNNTQKKKMSSITIRLQWNLIWRKVGLFIGMDFLLIVMMTAIWIFEQEYIRNGDFRPERERTFYVADRALSSLRYSVADKNGDKILDIPANMELDFLIKFMLVLAVVQLLGMFIRYNGERRKISRILRPIDEIALKADELGQMDFSDEMVHEIEDAIDSLQPGDTQMLSLNDQALKGVEAAMNNMLIRMRNAQRQQTRFVNDASHELRTPIAVIEGYVNMLARWGKEDEKVLDESIAAIQHESAHMKYLVEQLLFLARGDSGKTTLKQENVVLNDLMQEIYEESFMIDEEHPYRYNKYDERLEVTADSGLLKQAVRILIDNAAKYTNKGDEIILSIGRNEKGRAYLQVQDTGIGMAENDVSHMFERFYRADEARNFQGTGLGLSIAKWIVDKHRGHFEILSRTDLGTRIRIVL